MEKHHLNSLLGVISGDSDLIIWMRANGIGERKSFKLESVLGFPHQRNPQQTIQKYLADNNKS